MKYSEIKKDSSGGFLIGDTHQVPDISLPQETEISTLFLGPKAENHKLLSELINKALIHIYGYRVQYSQHDPEVITQKIKSSIEYQNSSTQIQNAFVELLNYLLKCYTLFWLALSGPQASTSTTPLAMMVSWDLCQMVGFPFNKNIEPWSHITADGTISSIESLWTSRELRYLLFAICPTPYVKQYEQYTAEPKCL